MARRRWQIDFKNTHIGERETPGINCYKFHKVYKFYNGLFKWSWDGQLLILHRWNAVFVPNLNLVYGNQDSVSRIRIWRVLDGTLLRLILRCLCDKSKNGKLVLARCGFVRQCPTIRCLHLRWAVSPSLCIIMHQRTSMYIMLISVVSA